MRGMSLIELMVAMVIGLIGIIVISQVFAVSEGLKRTTTGGSDAQVNGNIGLFTIERELRFAGFGMVTNNSNMLGCNTLAHNSARLGGVTDFNFVMAPVLITVGAAGAPDSIRVVYSNAPNLVEGNAFAVSAASGADFPLKNSAGIQVASLVVAFEHVPPAAPKDCSLAEVTGFQPAALNTLIHAVNGTAYSYTTSLGTTVNLVAKHNKAGGLGVAYTLNAMLFDMGRNPVVKTFTIANGKLRTESLIPYAPALDVDSDGDSDVEIADGIVQMKAQYGKDTDGDRIIDTWDTVTPTTAALWMQVRAIRIALLARSAQYERTQVTPAAPTWQQDNGTAVAFTMTNPADGTDWRNYRYSVYQTTVPVRNMIWSNDP